MNSSVGIDNSIESPAGSNDPADSIGSPASAGFHYFNSDKK